MARFVAPGRFIVRAKAEIPKQDEPEGKAVTFLSGTKVRLFLIVLRPEGTGRT